MKIDPRAKFLLYGIAFLASEAVFGSITWPRFGPTIAFLIGLVPLAIFGWLTAPLVKQVNRREEPPDNSKVQSVLGYVFGIAWLVAMISWFPGAEIESAALKQPDRRTAEFTQPLHLKGVIRYVTPNQAKIDEISHWTFLGGCLVGFGAALLRSRLKKKKTEDS